jgi:3-oxoacyl-[acyl-carrier-protein] synthase II
MQKRVVITGLGPVTPIGTGKEEFWDSLISGKSGARRINFEGFDMDQYDSQIACTVENFSLTDFIERNKDFRYLGRTSELAMAGTKLALDDAGFELDFVKRDKGHGDYVIRNVDPTHVGVILGVGAQNMDLCERWHQIFLKNRSPKRLSPFALPHVQICSVAVNVTMKYGLKGMAFNVSTACASSNHAMIEAYKQILQGPEDVIVTGGADACITPYVFGGFVALRAMSKRNDEPEKASRPFDRDRDGFVMGEGAGTVVLEELSHALKRGAHIYCEMTGYGATSDAYHITMPDPTGDMQARAIEDALKMAGASPEDIDYINAHGTSTPLNDPVETQAIKTALGKHAYEIPISSTKSMTGHLIGASGGIETIATALMIERHKIHPTINLDTPGEGCDLNYLPNEAIDRTIGKAINNSFGFGGQNASIVLEKWHEG